MWFTNQRIHVLAVRSCSNYIMADICVQYNETWSVWITVLYKLKLQVNMYPFISAFNGKHASSLRAYVYHVGPTPSGVK